MRTQTSPDLCAGFKLLIAFDFNLHSLQLFMRRSIDGVEGAALYSLTEGMADSGRASDLCIALFTEDGRYVATTRTDTKGRFSFASVTLPIGGYRLIATSKAFKDLNISIELKQARETDLEKRDRMLLQMRMK